MDVFLSLGVACIPAIISSVGTYFLTLKKISKETKGEIEILENKHKMRIEELEKQNKLDIDKLNASFEVKFKEFGSNKLLSELFKTKQGKLLLDQMTRKLSDTI